MSTSIDVPGNVLKVFVVNQLHYRYNDPHNHNEAIVRGIYRTKEEAIECLNKLYEETIVKHTEYGLPFTLKSYADVRVVSQEGHHEADTDKFDIEEHEIA